MEMSKCREGDEEFHLAFCILFSFRQLAEKVERFARKEAELAERGERVPVIYPDPSVPYEEQCIM